MKMINLTKDSFNAQIIHGVSLVDFYAPSYSSSMIQQPIAEELAKEVGNQAVIAKVNIDQEADLVAEYKVTVIPTLLIFKDGYVVEKLEGLQSLDFLKQKIDSYLRAERSCSK